MAAISSVKSETTYYVQLAFFGMAAAAGIVGSVALLFGYSLGRRILQVLSWLGFAYFTGAALLVPVFHVVRAPEVTLTSLGFIVLVAGLIGVTGLPFLFMARKFGNAQPAVQADAAATRRLT
jgi:hypothetical protein